MGGQQFTHLYNYGEDQNLHIKGLFAINMKGTAFPPFHGTSGEKHTPNDQSTPEDSRAHNNVHTDQQRRSKVPAIRTVSRRVFSLFHIRISKDPGRVSSNLDRSNHRTDAFDNSILPPPRLQCSLSKVSRVCCIESNRCL